MSIAFIVGNSVGLAEFTAEASLTDRSKIVGSIRLKKPSPVNSKREASGTSTPRLDWYDFKRPYLSGMMSRPGSGSTKRGGGCAGRPLGRECGDDPTEGTAGA